MALHDSYPRVTPYELAIPGRAFAEERFAAIRDEAEERGAATGDPGGFLLLGEVGHLVQDLASAEGGGRERLQHLGALAFHAFHLWEAGEPCFLLSTPAARYLVEAAVGGGASTESEGPGPVTPAGYLQLPRNLFWARVGEEEVPEALDGIFWTAGGATIHLLGVLGIRGDRPGVSVVELSGVPVDALGESLSGPMRDEGGDFATDLPGGEIDRLYSITTGGELVKLMALVFRYLAGAPEVLADADRGPSEEERGDGPMSSMLPFQRITLTS
jgi:hypothetical protein